MNKNKVIYIKFIKFISNNLIILKIKSLLYKNVLLAKRLHIMCIYYIVYNIKLEYCVIFNILYSGIPPNYIFHFLGFYIKFIVLIIKYAL